MRKILLIICICFTIMILNSCGNSKIESVCFEQTKYYVRNDDIYNVNGKLNLIGETTDSKYSVYISEYDIEKNVIICENKKTCETYFCVKENFQLPVINENSVNAIILEKGEIKSILPSFLFDSPNYFYDFLIEEAVNIDYKGIVDYNCRINIEKNKKFKECNVIFNFKEYKYINANCYKIVKSENDYYIKDENDNFYEISNDYKRMFVTAFETIESHCNYEVMNNYDKDLWYGNSYIKDIVGYLNGIGILYDNTSMAEILSFDNNQVTLFDMLETDCNLENVLDIKNSLHCVLSISLYSNTYRIIEEVMLLEKDGTMYLLLYNRNAVYKIKDEYSNYFVQGVYNLHKCLEIRWHEEYK